MRDRKVNDERSSAQWEVASSFAPRFDHKGIFRLQASQLIEHRILITAHISHNTFRKSRCVNFVLAPNCLAEN